jgi:ferredoxin-NADP reductase
MRADLARAVLKSPWLRPLNDVPAIDDLLGQLRPTWTLGRIKARVVEVITETRDTRTFVMRPTWNWPGSKAGQHVPVEVEIDGVRHVRHYSLSSAPERSRAIAITVKRQAGGRVSSWLHDHVGFGDTLTLGPPAGDFVLPAPLPERLLMVSAGSGITPLMSMLRHLRRQGYAGNVTFVHVCRTRGDAIFGDELARLAGEWRALTLHVQHSSEVGRLGVSTLLGLVPDHAARHTLLCGPPAFMAPFVEHWRVAGMAGRLQLEHFALPAGPPLPGKPVEVRCVRSGRVLDVAGAEPLLVEAERAGLRPRHGCRMGICHTCQCVKQSGTVENLLTGKVSAEPGERIQICISRARSDLVLEL